MARTKQTARKCLVQAAPRKKIGKNTASKSKSGRKRLQPDIESQEEQMVNTQQFSIKFDDQAKCQKQCVSGKVISCKTCEAIFTAQSKYYDKKSYQKLQNDKSLPDQKKQKFLKGYDGIWICEFCLSHNNIPKNYNVPTHQNPCFLVQKANKKSKINNQNQHDDDGNKILIFCVDVSGSMEVKVSGKKSRLACVQEAITDEINRMKFENENIKIGLIAFGSEVLLIGDSKSFKQTKLNINLYHDFDKIVKQCSKITNFCAPLQKSYKQLKNRIQKLTIWGSTALGPGLLASIELASKGAVGSKVIICTDGQANVGIGGTFFSTSAKNIDFYEKAANFAKQKRVSVSVLSLKGDKCNLKELGKLSLATNGSVLKINPTALGTQFSKIAKQQILGTQSKLVIKVNKIFEIISHNPTQLSADKTTLTQDFGNFSADTQLTFQFNVLNKQQAAKKPQVDLDIFKQERVPMQIQLTYIGRDGNRYMQIITDWRQLTEDEKEILEGANFGLFAASVLQRASTKIKNSEFKQAESILKGYWSLVKEKFEKTESKEDLNKFGGRVKKIENILGSKLRKTGKSPIKSTSTKKITAKKSLSKSKNQKERQRSRQKTKKGRKNKIQQSKSEVDDLEMSSDQQQQILWKEMRARSRSNSPKRK